jgi:hypothetical protein
MTGGSDPATSTTTTTVETTTVTSAPDPTPKVSGSVANRDLQVLLPKTATASEKVYMLVKRRTGTSYFYRGQCSTDPAGTAWECQEPAVGAAVHDDSAYDVYLVTKIGAVTADPAGRPGVFVVPEPAAGDVIGQPIPTP